MKKVIVFIGIILTALTSAVYAQYYGGYGYGGGYGGYYNGGYNPYAYVSPGQQLFSEVGLYNQYGHTRIYNRTFINFHGDGYMMLPSMGMSAYYIGHIDYGYPHNSGTLYYYTVADGWCAFQGGFYYGIPHGQGQLYCSKKGYFSGTWNDGIIVQQAQQIVPTQPKVESFVRDVEEKQQDYAPRDSKTATFDYTNVTEKKMDSKTAGDILGRSYR